MPPSNWILLRTPCTSEQFVRECIEENVRAPSSGGWEPDQDLIEMDVNGWPCVPLSVTVHLEYDRQPYPVCLAAVPMIARLESVAAERGYTLGHAAGCAVARYRLRDA